MVVWSVCVCMCVRVCVCVCRGARGGGECCLTLWNCCDVPAYSQQLNKVLRYTHSGEALPSNLYLTDGGT